ncbi:hypothetical protein [Nocardia abscessus]|uniref:hypothetical protein n=1 Tax=Nocardia abscessus TaxID=120957 RepID=UPI002457CAE2|nr:hypothetical protein [Nocardia abscessus]
MSAEQPTNYDDNFQRIDARELNRSHIGKFLVRNKNGYCQPGQILDLVPVVNESFLLLAVRWMPTAVDRESDARLKLQLDSAIRLMEPPVAHPLPGTAAAESANGYVRSESAQVPGTGTVSSSFVELVQSGDFKSGVTESQAVRARDLTPDHVGKVFGNSDPEAGVNYLIKVLNFRVIEEGRAPGVQLWLRHGQIDRRPAYDDEWHVPFDREFEFVELTPFLG